MFKTYPAESDVPLFQIAVELRQNTEDDAIIPITGWTFFVSEEGQVSGDQATEEQLTMIRLQLSEVTNVTPKRRAVETVTNKHSEKKDPSKKNNSDMASATDEEQDSADSGDHFREDTSNFSSDKKVTSRKANNRRQGKSQVGRSSKANGKVSTTSLFRRTSDDNEGHSETFQSSKANRSSPRKRQQKGSSSKAKDGNLSTIPSPKGKRRKTLSAATLKRKRAYQGLGQTSSEEEASPSGAETASSDKEASPSDDQASPSSRGPPVLKSASVVVKRLSGSIAAGDGAGCSTLFSDGGIGEAIQLWVLQRDSVRQFSELMDHVKKAHNDVIASTEKAVEAEKRSDYKSQMLVELTRIKREFRELMKSQSDTEKENHRNLLQQQKELYESREKVLQERLAELQTDLTTVKARLNARELQNVIEDESPAHAAHTANDNKQDSHKITGVPQFTQFMPLPPPLTPAPVLLTTPPAFACSMSDVSPSPGLSQTSSPVPSSPSPCSSQTSSPLDVDPATHPTAADHKLVSAYVLSVKISKAGSNIFLYF
jgi:hypothetical protein